MSPHALHAKSHYSQDIVVGTDRAGRRNRLGPDLRCWPGSTSCWSARRVAQIVVLDSLLSWTGGTKFSLLPRSSRPRRAVRAGEPQRAQE